MIYLPISIGARLQCEYMLRGEYCHSLPAWDVAPLYSRGCFSYAWKPYQSEGPIGLGVFILMGKLHRENVLASPHSATIDVNFTGVLVVGCGGGSASSPFLARGSTLMIYYHHQV